MDKSAHLLSEIYHNLVILKGYISSYLLDIIKESERGGLWVW